MIVSLKRGPFASGASSPNQHPSVESASDSTATQNASPNPTQCANCGAPLRGPFCFRCGQRNRERIAPLTTILIDLLSETLNFDTRFFRTLRRLLLHPGRLTNEYIAGRRAGYVPPLRLFVFSSFVLLLLLGFASNWALSDLPTGTRSAQSTVSTPLGADTTLADTSAQVSAVRLNTDTTGDGESAFINLPASVRDTLVQVADSLRRQPDTSAQFKFALLNGVLQATDSPQHFVQTVVGRLSGLAFLMLPVFALLLKLLYIRSGRLYIEHLILGLHTHAFLFILLIVVTLLSLSGVSELAFIASLLVSFGPGLYLLVALRRVYQQSWLLTLVKAGILFSAYGAVLGVAIVGYLMLTLVLM